MDNGGRSARILPPLLTCEPVEGNEHTRDRLRSARRFRFAQRGTSRGQVHGIYALRRRPGYADLYEVSRITLLSRPTGVMAFVRPAFGTPASVGDYLSNDRRLYDRSLSALSDPKYTVFRLPRVSLHRGSFRSYVCVHVLACMCMWVDARGDTNTHVSEDIVDRCLAGVASLYL